MRKGRTTPICRGKAVVPGKNAKLPTYSIRSSNCYCTQSEHTLAILHPDSNSASLCFCFPLTKTASSLHFGFPKIQRKLNKNSPTCPHTNTHTHTHLRLVERFWPRLWSLRLLPGAVCVRSARCGAWSIGWALFAPAAKKSRLALARLMMATILFASPSKKPLEGRTCPLCGLCMF